MGVLYRLSKVISHPKQLNDYFHSHSRPSRGETVTAAVSSSSSSLSAAVNTTQTWATDENELRGLTGDALIRSSGKLAVLDRLLIRLKNQGRRVLLFAQFKETLDVLEEYLIHRFGHIGQQFYRLDGETNRALRETDIRAFNSPSSPQFLYLISTKAGSLGSLNLSTADTIVLFDVSWNPLGDLLAQDCAHRLGQNRQVAVYRLVAANTFEERLLQLAEDQLRSIIQSSSSRTAAGIGIGGRGKLRRRDGAGLRLSGRALVALLRHGQEDIAPSVSSVASLTTMEDEDIDAHLSAICATSASSSAERGGGGEEEASAEPVSTADEKGDEEKGEEEEEETAVELSGEAEAYADFEDNEPSLTSSTAAAAAGRYSFARAEEGEQEEERHPPPHHDDDDPMGEIEEEEAYASQGKRKRKSKR